MTKATSYPESAASLLSDAQKKQLYVGQPTAVYNVEPTLYGTLYTVPEGFNTVLTNIYAFIEEGDAANDLTYYFHLMIRDDSAIQDLFVARSFEIPRLNAIRIDTNIVLGQGDTIHAGGTFDSDVSVSTTPNQINLVLTGKELPL